MSEIAPSGFTTVRSGKRGRRSYYAYWRDAEGRHGVRLGPAHVKDTGRRSGRGGVVWRAGDGPPPTAQHLTPKDAAARLRTILEAVPRAPVERQPDRSLQDAVEGWMQERGSQRGLKRSTTMDYQDLFERLYRDLGADTPVSEFEDGRLQGYFANFEAQRLVGPERATRAREAGETVREVVVERWTAQPASAQALEVATSISPQSSAGCGSTGVLAHIVLCREATSALVE